MSEVLSAVASALRADQSRLEQSSLNAANASTPGYRRSGLVAMAFHDVLESSRSSTAIPREGASARLYPPVYQRFTDSTPGPLQQTGRPLDVAVEGEGYLSFTDGSRTWLTRTASLSINADGELVGPKGLRVTGMSGAIRPTSGHDVSVEASGDVIQGGQVLGRIRLVIPTEGTPLVSNDGVLFELSEGHQQDATAGKGVIRAGFIEGSNTNSLREMLTVMESIRHFESLVRLAQGYDEVLGKAIQKLGEV